MVETCWTRAFDEQANDILVDLCNDVADHGSVNLANYRMRLFLHTRSAAVFKNDEVNPILVELCNDVADHGGVDLRIYRARLGNMVLGEPTEDQPDERLGTMEARWLADLVEQHLGEAGPLNIATGAQRILLDKLRRMAQEQP